MATKYKRLISLAKTQAWAMLPEYMEVVCEVLTRRASGKKFSDLELAVRLGSRRGVDNSFYDDDTGRGGRRRLYAVESGVALIPLEGVILPKAGYFDRISGATGLDAFQSRIAAAAEDDEVKAILLVMASPGGVVLGVSEAEAAVRRAAAMKPTHAFVQDLCCSACYWIASAATQIHAPLTTQTGSVGVYRLHVDYSQADEEAGEKYTYIFAGDRKVDGHPHGPLAGKAKERWQASVDDVYRMFTSTVMRNRRIGGDPAEATGHGESFYAEQAKRMGLVDTHLSKREAIELLAGKASGKTTVSFAKASSQNTGAAAPNEILQGGETSGLVLRESQASEAAAAATIVEECAVSKELKALLYAAGVVKSLDESDDKCWTLLEGYAAAKGLAFSREDEQPVMEYFSKQAKSGRLGDSQTNSQIAAAGVERQEAVIEAAQREERRRVQEIQARATLLRGQGFIISDEALQDAIDKGRSVAEAVEIWTRTNPSPQTEKRIATPNVTQNELQAAEPLVSEALSVLLGAQKPSECKIREAAYLASKGSMRLAERVCEKAGHRVHLMEDEDICKEFLRLSAGPIGRRTSLAAASFDNVDQTQVDMSGASLPYYGAGSHPNLFANPASRVLMENLKVAKTTYQIWGHRMPDATRLGIEEGVGYAGYGELPREIDGVPNKPQGPQASKRLYWIEPEPYSDVIGLTWEMVHRNELMNFAKMLQQKQVAAVRTVNRFMIELLASNPQLVVDGKELFHTDHNNNITSGGAPSVAQLAKHDLAYGKQVDSIDGQTEILVTPKYILVPTDLRVAAYRTIEFMKVQTNAVTDETKLGVWDGLEVVVDAMLRTYSQTAWYTFADPNDVPCLVYRYLQGYGEGGRTTMWFDPETETQKWKVKIVFGVAAARYEGVTRDAGAGGV